MSRGKPKPKLRDLTRAKPTKEDYAKWRDTIFDQHPMVCAIWGASMIEHELEDIIRRRLKRNDDALWAKLTERGAPLSSFAGKIDLAYAIGALDETTRANLHTVRDIRNTFAHTKKVLDFEDPIIIDALSKIKEPKQRGYKRNIRLVKRLAAIKTLRSQSFAVLCIAMNTLMLEIITRTLRARNRRSELKRNKAKGWGLWEQLMNPPTDPKSPLQLYSQSQSGNPNPPVQGGLLAGLSAYFPDKDKK